MRAILERLEQAGYANPDGQLLTNDRDWHALTQLVHAHPGWPGLDVPEWADDAPSLAIDPARYRKAPAPETIYTATAAAVLLQSQGQDWVHDERVLVTNEFGEPFLDQAGVMAMDEEMRGRVAKRGRNSDHGFSFSVGQRVVIGPYAFCEVLAVDDKGFEFDCLNGAWRGRYDLDGQTLHVKATGSRASGVPLTVEADVPPEIWADGMKAILDWRARQ